MHYGHPDIMNKEYMMQQGGVSKATKTLNLSEDIFAGMDFVLRGGGRTIKHREYFHLAKGRDLGFNTVLAFFSKLSSGAGEQLITRQTLRLGSLLPLPEFLSFYYAHMGHYLSQWAVSWGLPVLTLVWLLILLNGCEDSHDLSIKCSAAGQSAASIMAEAWQYIYSGNLLIVFLLAQMAPIFFEVWMQAGLVTSVIRLIKQLLTLSPVMFIFQAKAQTSCAVAWSCFCSPWEHISAPGEVIGFYTMNELKYGGATYVQSPTSFGTGRRIDCSLTRDGFPGLSCKTILNMLCLYCGLPMQLRACGHLGGAALCSHCYGRRCSASPTLEAS
ncbi:GSC2 [Symbiodinium natans]|uniref:GSC2 protein n=1 Tax=Symbiodinium natans TaxID=878477 RepID=A0A812PS58_9DINO|nr:GSC2 [Symbiodinium natans]